mmetsp:Transcript_28522/g.59627  ORF Transcript_28522/g.59627 Transcript_28522/m.59627 type:complete len:226 (-) Transcript_28522:525-1202(-)
MRNRLRVHPRSRHGQLPGLPCWAAMLRQCDSGAESGWIDVDEERQHLSAHQLPRRLSLSQCIERGPAFSRRAGVCCMRQGPRVHCPAVCGVLAMPARILQARGGAWGVHGVPSQHLLGRQRGAEHRRVRGMHGARHDQVADRAERGVGMRVRQRVLPGRRLVVEASTDGVAMRDVSAGSRVQLGPGMRLAERVLAKVLQWVRGGGDLELGFGDWELCAEELPRRT